MRRNEAAKETIGLPLGRLRCVGYPFEQRREDAVELRGSGQIHRLAGIVGHAMIACAEPILEDLLFGTARNPTEFESQRWHAHLDEAVLIAANKTIGVGFLVGLHLKVSR